MRAAEQKDAIEDVAPVDPGSTGADALELGSKIRGLRRSRGLTLDSVATTAGVSRSLISQVERGLASPSIASLRGIAMAIGVPMAALFLDADADRSGTMDSLGRQLVVRSGHRRHLHARSGELKLVRYELLTPDSNRQIEFLLGDYEPGAVSPATFASHCGEENVYCLRGSVVFVVGGDDFVLDQGDSISFDCTVSHRIENRSAQHASIIVAITPPSF